MIYDDTLLSRVLNLLAGTLVFFIIVTGATYYLQSSLVVKSIFSENRQWAYYHWGVVLLAVPIIAGIAQRLLNITYPIFTTLVGAILSAVVLYPHYVQWWAVPPGIIHMVVYVVVITGIGFMATQPLKAVFMTAFHIGRFKLPSFSIETGNGKRKKTARKSDMSKTQRMRTKRHGDLVAMMELLVGFASLALSIFSIFFLGRG